MLWLRDTWYQCRSGFTLLFLIGLALLGAIGAGVLVATGLILVGLVADQGLVEWTCAAGLMFLPYVLGGMTPLIRDHLRAPQ